MNNVDKAKAAYAVERLLDVDELLKTVDPATLTGDDKSWVQRAKREAADAMTIYQTLRAGAGKTSSDVWKLAVDSDGIEVRYRPEATTRFASVCVALNLATSLSLVLTIANEVGLLGGWMPAFLGFEACTLLKVSRFRQLVWMRVRMPPPFAPREVVFEAMGVDALDRTEPCVLIVVRTPDPVDWPGVDLQAPPDRRDPSAVRASVLLAGALIVPKSETACAFANVMNIDPQLRYLPGWLFNWVNRRLVWYAFDAFRNKAAKLQMEGLPQEYLDQIRCHKETYDELNRRVKAWEGVPSPPPDVQKPSIRMTSPEPQQACLSRQASQ